MISAIAAMAGLSRKTLHVDVILRGIVTERVQAVLSSLIMDIESGKIRFRRVGQEWQTEYLEPSLQQPPPQPRVIRADDYSPWARCQSCGSPRFSAFKADKLYFACDGCVGEADRQMLGFRPTKGISVKS